MKRIYFNANFEKLYMCTSFLPDTEYPIKSFIYIFIKFCLNSIVEPVLRDNCPERPPALGDHFLKTTWNSNPLDKTCPERPPAF